MNIVSRIPTELVRERMAWSPHALPPNREPPRPDQTLQGVIVQPPRESKVSVRVEIVTDERRERDVQQHADADAYAESSPPQPRWLESVVELPPSAAGAARLGAPDVQHAVQAYRAHADWQPYTAAAGAGSSEPRRLSVRA